MCADEGALLEPLSVGVYSVRRAGVNAGDTLLICGAGPIGLVTMLAARAFAASHICISGLQINLVFRNNLNPYPLNK